ncbi:hypothetical protein ACNTMW_01540 [Planosporangium sp. 12N6]
MRAAADVRTSELLTALTAHGHLFRVSANGVRLTDAVPARYLTRVEES